jgi:hypothetical protein
MSLAIALPFKAGIRVILIDSLSVEIRELRFNIACWDEDCHSLTRLTWFLAQFNASLFNLSYSVSSILPVSIDKHNQCLLDPVLSRSVIGKFLPEPFPYELLT